ncbi:C-C motif chemokine 2-like [Cheilinus undulatus]|uniref:C-C motif chemokine 2-like n=1 Tax=Cheilinus undulatus TaxID=241271 RepID=UPI001BD506E8|nr:C-C motif chemokine 2-like [Cheilinus undulatus]
MSSVSVGFKRTSSVDSLSFLIQRRTMTSLNIFVLLFLGTIMLSTASAGGGTASCCRALTSTQLHRDRLQSYYKQHKSTCPIDAVVRICSDPRRMWTKTSMAYLDGKNSVLHGHHRANNFHPNTERPHLN